MQPTVNIPWPLSSAPGARPQESAGRLINTYAEPLQPESGPAKVVWRKSPGLTSFATTGFTGFRGGLLVNNLAFVAVNQRLLTVDSSGTVVNVGALSGTLPVTFAKNNLTPTAQIGCVTENGAFLVTTSSIAAWPDADLPSPNSISFQDGYFFWTIGDRRVFSSDINSTAVNALSFTTIQSQSSDTLLRGIPYNGLMWFFASSSIEVYQNAGASIAAPAFPYARVSIINRGLLGANAVAGWEVGFGQLMWVADDFGVYQLNQFSPEKVSPPDLDRLIEQVSDKTTLRASCYVHAGHSIWVIASPTWTWEFNLNTQKWTERWSMLSGAYTPWRATGSFNAFGKWLMGSAVTGNIVYADTLSFKEETDTMLFRMESGPVQNFPNRMRINRADFDFSTGQGIPSGSSPEQNPSVAISWTDDDGQGWSVPVLRTLGTVADGKRRVYVNNCGTSGPQGRRWRMDIGESVYSSFFGATQSNNQRAG